MRVAGDLTLGHKHYHAGLEKFLEDGSLACLGDQVTRPHPTRRGVFFGCHHPLQVFKNLPPFSTEMLQGGDRSGLRGEGHPTGKDGPGALQRQPRVGLVVAGTRHKR